MTDITDEQEAEFLRAAREQQAAREVPRCGTCKWAEYRELPDQEYTVNPLRCLKLSDSEHSTLHMDVTIQDEYLDDDDYMSVFVSPTFGCVLHEVKG